MKRVAAIGLVLAVCAGCNDRHKVQLTLEQVVLPPSAGVKIRGNGVPHGARNSFTTVSSGKTKSLFPASLAVARVEGDGAASNLAMAPLGDLMNWMSLWDDTWLVSEVVPITYPVRPKRFVTTGELLAAARDRHAGLCLIYTVATGEAAGIAVAEVRGELYDARNEKLLATLHADAGVLPIGEDELAPLPPPGRADVDRRHVDPWFIANDRFAELARDCVLELIERDDRPLAPAGPARRVQYVPSLNRYTNPQRR